MGHESHAPFLARSNRSRFVPDSTPCVRKLWLFWLLVFCFVFVLTPWLCILKALLGWLVTPSVNHLSHALFHARCDSSFWFYFWLCFLGCALLVLCRRQSWSKILCSKYMSVEVKYFLRRYACFSGCVGYIWQICVDTPVHTPSPQNIGKDLFL